MFTRNIYFIKSKPTNKRKSSIVDEKAKEKKNVKQILYPVETTTLTANFHTEKFSVCLNDVVIGTSMVNMNCYSTHSKYKS